MKIRKDFVTNSSSSSFICEVCGYIESGWDLCLEDAGMFECKNGHTMCIDHILKPLSNDEEDYNNEDSYYDRYYNVPAELCPICQLEQLSLELIAQYMLKQSNVDAETVTKRIKEKFGTWDKFSKYLDG